ncbi:MAG TPA: succinate dehydrogenase cytochrome b subunit [Blastocatellia bacterium]|nr:succinate dehydrogenase cytochrome b subunit [Blastocatellia bacterium]
MSASAQSLRPSSIGLLRRLWQSSLGKKYVMAITGLGLFGFVLIHMIGNLQFFGGQTLINEYAETLKSKPPVLWGARLALLTAVVLHITAGVQLARANRQARPMANAGGKVLASTLANRTILISGLIVFAFIAFHLAHFTIGWVNASYLTLTDVGGRHDVRAMIIAGFSNPVISVFYIVSVGLLCLHLSHGVASTFQSLGLRSKKTEANLKTFAKVAAVFLFLGFCAIPVAVMTGLAK